jgi:CRP-like cAMP-binding protein
VRPEPHGGEARLAQTERLLYLRTIEAFSELPARDLAALAEQTHERTFAPGDALVREGRRGRALYMIVGGSVRLVRGGEDVGRAGPQAGVAALGLLAQSPSPFTAVAESETLALELQREPLMELLSDNFPMLQTVLRLLARGLLHSRQQLGVHAGYDEHPAPVRPPPARPLDLVERMLFLQDAFPFARQQVSALLEFARHAEEVRVGEGTPLWTQGDSADCTYVVYSGTVRGDADQGRHRFYRSQGAPVGALDSLAAEPRWYMATAATRLVALRITTEHLLDVLEDRFEISHAFLRMIARELLGLLDQRGVFGGSAVEIDGGRRQLVPEVEADMDGRAEAVRAVEAPVATVAESAVATAIETAVGAADPPGEDAETGAEPPATKKEGD